MGIKSRRQLEDFELKNLEDRKKKIQAASTRLPYRKIKIIVSLLILFIVITIILYIVWLKNESLDDWIYFVPGFLSFLIFLTLYEYVKDFLKNKKKER